MSTAGMPGGGAPGDGAGAWLRERRLARGWSKAEFARRLHAAMSTREEMVPSVASITRSVAGWERDGSYPRDRWRAVICEVLGAVAGDFPSRPGTAWSAATVELDAGDPRPWAQVARKLLGQIGSGELAPGQPMPALADIAARNSVSVPTARRAYTHLRGRGIIRYWPGAGHQVIDSRRDSLPQPALTSAGDASEAGDPPARRRLVGAALRDYQERLGYSLADAAEVLECDRSKISRVETGQRGIRSRELRLLLAEYGAGDPEQAALVAIARPAAVGAWWQEFADDLDEATRDYYHLELVAAEIFCFDPLLIPALLRTPGYAAALAACRSLHAADGETKALAAMTAARQHAIIGQHRARLTAVIAEAALHQVTGGPEVMRAQLEHLAGAAGDDMAVTIRVLPFTRGAQAAGIGGTATMLRFTPAHCLGVVHLPRPGRGGITLTGRADLACYATAFRHLAEAAFSPADSALLLRDLAASEGSRTADHLPSSRVLLECAGCQDRTLPRWPGATRQTDPEQPIRTAASTGAQLAELPQEPR